MTWAGQPDGVTIGPDADGVGAILSLAAAVVAVVGGHCLAVAAGRLDLGDGPRPHGAPATKAWSRASTLNRPVCPVGVRPHAA